MKVNVRVMLLFVVVVVVVVVGESRSESMDDNACCCSVSNRITCSNCHCSTHRRERRKVREGERVFVRSCVCLHLSQNRCNVG